MKQNSYNIAIYKKEKKVNFHTFAILFKAFVFFANLVQTSSECS